MSEFKGTGVYEKSKQYAKNKCCEVIGSKFIPETDLTVYDACELDFRNGYNQALEDSIAKEMLEMLKILIHDYKNYTQNILQDPHRLNRIKEIEQLIKQATEL